MKAKKCVLCGATASSKFTKFFNEKLEEIIGCVCSVCARIIFNYFKECEKRRK